jgi:hypothetical protein
MASDLPAPCVNCERLGGYWVFDGRGMKRCDCARGLELSRRDLRPVPPPRANPVLTAEEIAAAVEALSALPYFPAAEMARTMIGDAIGLLCRDGHACFELCREMIARYRQWPGVRELRIVYCALVGPPLSGEDLQSAISEVYPDGFAPQKPYTPALAALPAGHVATADDELDQAIQGAVKQLGMKR